VTRSHHDVTDPGWRPVARQVVLRFVAPWRRPSATAADRLTALRTMWAGVAAGSVGIGVVAVVLVVGGPPGAARFDAGPVAAVVLLLGISASLLVRFVERPLPGADAAELLRCYPTRMYVRLAAADAAALAGFCGTLLTWSLVPYVVGLAVAAVGFWRASPTRSAIEADQRAVDAAGSRLDLLDVLLAGDGSGTVRSAGH
jgi:hypothetical protein